MQDFAAPTTQTPTAPAPVRVVDRQGRVFEADTPEQAQALLAERDPTGAALFELDTPELAARRQQLREYGGTGGQVAAGAVGALRGATLGLSDALVAGVDEVAGTDATSTLQALREVNPTATSWSEAIGGLAPLLIPGGAGARGATAAVRGGLEGAALATEGASLTRGTGGLLRSLLRGASAPSRLVTGAAEAAEARTLAALGTEAAGSLGTRMLGRAASMGAGGAVEGAAMGLQQSITESVLGDEPLTAERLLANVGLNALLGGGAGGLFGAGVAALSGVGRGTRDVISRAFREATGQDLRRGVAEAWEAGSRVVAEGAAMTTGADRRVISEALGPDGAELRQLVARGDDLFEEASREAREAITRAEGGTRHVSDLWGRGMKRDQIRGLVSTERLADQIGVATGHVTGIRRLAEGVLADAANGATFEAAGIAGRARDLLQRVGAAEQMLAGTVRHADAADVATDLFQALDELKRGVGDVQQRIERVDPGSSFLQQLRGESGYEGIRRTLEDDALWGAGAAGAQRDVNRAFTRYLERRRAFVQNFLTDGARDTVDPFRRLPEADSARIDSFLRAAGTARNDTRAEVFRSVLDAQADLADTMARHLDLGDLAPDAVSAAENARRARSVFDALEDRVSRVNQFRALEQGTGVERALVAQAGGFVLGGPIGAAIATALASPTTLARGLGAIERAAQRVTMRIDRGVSSYVSRALDAARSASRRAARVGRAAARKVVVRSSVEEFEAEIERVVEAAAHPEQTQQRIAEATGEIGAVAPGVQAQVQQQAQRGLAFLVQRIPPSARPADALMPGIAARRREASSTERARFMRYVRAVNDPLSALDDLDGGLLPPESVEVLRELYPQLHAQMGAAFVRELASRVREGDEVPYTFRRDLGSLLGAATDPSLAPAAIADYQNVARGSAAQADAIEARQFAGPDNRRGGDLSALGRNGNDMTRAQMRERRNGG